MNKRNWKILPLLLMPFQQACQPSASTHEEKTEAVAAVGIDSTFKGLEEGYHFYAIGDWGRSGQFKQKELAETMELAATEVEPEFIISTGDNFYPNGVSSVDDTQWNSSFESVYSGHHLHCDWHVILGNHDYRGNAQAQIEYSDISRRWNMPSRYYTFDKRADDGTKISFVFIDTSPFELKYYRQEKYKAVWRQDTTRQLAWMDSVLAASEANWKIVVGHHPLYSGGKRLHLTEDVKKQLEPVLKRHQVDFYICGHEHDLQHIKAKGPTHYVVSGAGSEVRPTGKMEASLFAESVQGFAAFSITKAAAQLQFMDFQGKVIYTTLIKKE